MTRCPHCNEPLDIVPRNTLRGQATRAAEAAGQICGVPTADVMGHTRRHNPTRARHLAMWALRELGWSFPEIGAAFDRDHSSAQYAIKRVRQTAEGTGLQVLERMREQGGR